ncbi:hypothetical protein ATY81_25155 [Rhizobium sp. R72]|uniref:hypothetical protein n=1 Tax=unclassified Rhizobium TaxID=2613769 RepID=UPI000B5313D3|nr:MULTISPECIES: hypothetical protein [unclassified Rhizobium]OWW00092.1 hypothetical protein ATY81_25155 [Rhizobium sp. R72]OWW00483.1 hypothetical protein ATY80_25155 [Rhizobium sp. R711]
MFDDALIDARLPVLSDVAIRQVFDEIDANGFSCIPNYIHAEDLSRMQDFVAMAVARSQNEYVVLRGSDAVLGSGMDELATSAQFTSIFSRLYELAFGNNAPQVTFYQILRCLTGKGAARNSLIFHYDSYLITGLIPVTIPATGNKGDLLLFPNTRKVRAFYATNLFDKLLLDNRITQAILRVLARSRNTPFVRVQMVPGNLYLFWGYRSIHTNEPCAPDKVRATALFHFADPHAASSLKASLRAS